MSVLRISSSLSRAYSETCTHPCMLSRLLVLVRTCSDRGISVGMQGAAFASSADLVSLALADLTRTFERTPPSKPTVCAVRSTSWTDLTGTRGGSTVFRTRTTLTVPLGYGVAADQCHPFRIPLCSREGFLFRLFGRSLSKSCHAICKKIQKEMNYCFRGAGDARTAQAGFV